MKLIPVNQENTQLYIDIGIQAYQEHYTYLWKDADTRPYLHDNYTPEVVTKDLENPNFEQFLIEWKGNFVGVLKIVRDAAVQDFSSDEALLIEKIYLLSKYSGLGIGKQCLNTVYEIASTMGKKVVWLDTMKNGRALSFYIDLGFQIIGVKNLLYPSVLEDQKAMYVLCYYLDDYT